MNGITIAPSELLSELVTESIRSYFGAVGVLVKDVPAPDPKHLLVSLKSLSDETGADFRIAYLREGGEEAGRELQLDSNRFSTDVEQAERWRNERDLDALIVVVAHGDEAKLSSLEELPTIGTRELKRALVKRALGQQAGVNDVQRRWWGLLGDDESVGLSQLIDYFLALSGREEADYLASSSREIYLLGFLPDPRLFDDGTPRAIRSRIEANRDLVARLQTLTPRDRRTISQAVSQAQEPDERQLLQKALEELHRSRWEGQGIQALSFESAERLMKVRSRRPQPEPNGDGTVRRDEKAVNVAAEALVDESRSEDVASLVLALKDQLLELDDTRLRPERIKTPMPGAGVDAESLARVDVLNMVSKVLDDGVYGALIESEPAGIEEFLRRFQPDRHVIAHWTREAIKEFLDLLAEDDAGLELASRFEAYDLAREQILPYLRSLCVEPLLVAAEPSARIQLLEFVDAYEQLNRTAMESHGALFNKFGPDANEIFGYLLLLETIIIRVGDQTYGLASPTHPLFIWHYAKYCELVASQRERLDAKDQALVIDAAHSLPNFFTSMFVPPRAIGEGVSLPYLGRLGPLPYFGHQVEASVSEDGLASVRKLIEAYLAFEPHSRLGFRLSLVEPPSIGPYLALIADLEEERKVQGASVIVYRKADSELAPQLGLDEADEDRVGRLFHALAPNRRFTFEVRRTLDGDITLPPEDVCHLVVIFDRGNAQSSRSRPANHPIQPLVLPRRLQYSIINKTVELEPAPGGPFDSYNQMVGRLSQGGSANYLAVHQDERLRTTLNNLMDRSSWLALADRHVDRDLRVGAIRNFTSRNGDRDVAAFIRTSSAFRRPLREVVRNYNAYINDQDLDDLLAQLSDLLDSGLLNLQPDANGRTNHNRIKGLLGTLIAARWFRQSPNRLLISLDGEEARRWLHLSDDPHRADLVGFEWTNDHCTVSVMEVKSVQSSGTEYSIDLEGIARGPAIDQLLSTRRLLSLVFQRDQSDELITTPARREIVREHLYRELSKASYLPEDRRIWADRFQRLLDGEVDVDLRCHLVDVKLGFDLASLSQRQVSARVGEDTYPIALTELNERLIEALTEPDRPEAGSSPSNEGGPNISPEPDLPSATDNEPSAAPDGSSSPASEATPSPVRSNPVDDQPVTERPRAMLGSAPGAYGRERDIWFDPALPSDQLPNPHIAITGETGSGKTQVTKAVIHELREYGLPTLILDFKDDYSDPAYAETEGFKVYDPSFQSLPFNPLAPPVDARSGHVNITHHLYQLTNIIKRIYKLGDQQAYRVREALKQAYETAGISLTAFTPGPEQTYPPFEAVKTELENEKGNEALLGRMSPIFDLGLFASGAILDFGEMAEESTVVRLGQLPGDETKNSVAEFFLMAVYNYLIRQPQVHRLSRLMVLDEAWRLVESPYLEPLMREGRAFGMGIMIATQFPRDLPEAVMGSTATKLFFSQTQLEQIREVQRTVVGKTSGPDADHLAGVMRGLAPLSCVLHSKQHSPFVRVSVKPYFERVSAAQI